MQESAGSLTYAVNKLTVPAVTWIAYWLHIALPDLVLLATFIYTVAQIVVLVRSHFKNKTQAQEKDNHGS